MAVHARLILSFMPEFWIRISKSASLFLKYKSSGGQKASSSRFGVGIALYASNTLCNPLFWLVASSFATIKRPGSKNTPAPYTIALLMTLVYTSRVRTRVYPYIKAAIRVRAFI